MKKVLSFWSLAAATLFTFSSSSRSLTVNCQRGIPVPAVERLSGHRRFGHDPYGPQRRASTQMRLAASVDVSKPSPDQAVAMEVRGWPQQLKKGNWSEQVPEGKTKIRYILDGTGSLSVIGGGTINVGPGTLIEISGDASIEWVASGEMIVLTPGFEEGGKLLIVTAAFVVLCGSLIAGSM